MSSPIRCIRRRTISAVEDAFGSMTGIVPRPSLLTWWSIHTTVCARSAWGTSEPRRSFDAQSRVTIVTGAFGNFAGSTNASAPGRTPTQRGCSKGWLPYEQTVFLPRDLRKTERPSMEPSASASGLMWQASATSSAASSASAARFSASFMFLLVYAGQDVLDALTSLGGLVLRELELRRHLQSDLPSEDHAKVRARRAKCG